MTASLAYRGTDIHVRGSIFFDLTRGFLDPAEVRGVDVTVPGLAGRTVQSRVKDRRSLLLEGYVQGADAEAWRDNIDILMVLMDRSLTPGSLVVGNNYLGLDGGTMTIAARCVNLLPGPIQGGMTFQKWSIELEAIGSPPDWA